MIPVEVAPLEARQFQLLVQRSGADPHHFKLRKFALPEGAGFRVRVVGRGAATVYETREHGAWTASFAADLDKGLFGPKGRPPPPASIAKALSLVETELARNGLMGLLRVLNSRVPHRFTAVYRLDRHMLVNVGTFDKHMHLEALDLRAVPLKDSYCQFVLRDGLFLTDDSGKDVRLGGHPYAGIVGSYIGVPISRTPGSLDGTLCHFDLASQPVSDDEYLLLERAADLLPAFLG
ncbi:MAG: hypothetical protein K0R89_3524 [Ramlibacter sp.]|jgi:hypothetical protein|nr:hypothetical protein [Ramlibacter sp.]